MTYTHEQAKQIENFREYIKSDEEIKKAKSKGLTYKYIYRPNGEIVVAKTKIRNASNV